MTGRTGTSTRLLIQRQCTALLTLTVVAAVALAIAYYGVHRNPALVRDDTSPAIREVAATRTALQSADRAVRESLVGGISTVVGKGEEYENQISAADQSLARVAELQLAGERGRQTLQPVRGVLKAYTESIDKAAQAGAEDNAPLRDSHLLSASSILNRTDTGILDRLTELQKMQERVLHQRTTFDRLLWTVWIASWLCLLTLMVLLVVTQLTVHRRFRRRLSPFLLLATVGVCAAVWPTIWAMQTQQQLTSARSSLERIIAESQRTSGDVSEEYALAQTRTITATAGRIDTDMDEGDRRAAFIAGIPAVGAGVAALIWLGMRPRIAEYRSKPR